jgi:spermidine/putrescine transport system permease protein
MSAIGHAGAPGGTKLAEPRPEPVAGGRRRRALPYLLLLPGTAYLFIFFVAPAVELFLTSLYDPSGSDLTGYQLTWHWANYVDVVKGAGPLLIRTALYTGVATLLTLVIGFPLAYAIALKGGRWKNLLLVCVVAPFFTSFLVRTLAWKVLLDDHSPITTTLDKLRVLPDHRLLSTAPAVIAGIVYNFLPFMVLPLYASLEKLDPRLLEAAKDLYAGPVRSFFRVTVPLAAPGIIAGTLLTFIPAAGDFVNAELLGGPNTTMIGNRIQSLFTKVHDYPSAGALSFLLMAAILVIVFVYIGAAGTDEVV